MSAGKIRPVRRACAFYFYMGILYGSFSDGINIRQHRTIPALRLKHRSGSCGTASALPKCSIMLGCGTRIVLRGQKPLALCDRCPCFGSLFPPLAALAFFGWRMNIAYNNVMDACSRVNDLADTVNTSLATLDQSELDAMMQDLPEITDQLKKIDVDALNNVLTQLPALMDTVNSLQSQVQSIVNLFSGLSSVFGR